MQLQSLKPSNRFQSFIARETAVRLLKVHWLENAFWSFLAVFLLQVKKIKNYNWERFTVYYTHVQQIR